MKSNGYSIRNLPKFPLSVQKNALLFLAMASTPISAFAAFTAEDKPVLTVYQTDSLPNPTTDFAFRTGESNGCGGIWYRVKSSNEALASRKFAIVLTAHTTNKTIDFHDRGQCEGSRATVGWVRFHVNSQP